MAAAAGRAKQALPVPANLAASFYRPLTIAGHSVYMRVYGPNGTALATAPTHARRSSGGTFAPAETSSPQPHSATVALRTLGGIDALIALQGIEDPLERRRRVVKQGRRALDALDELKLGLLAGTLDHATMLRLKAVSADLQDASGDDRLDQVLAEIDLRVAVELAKAGMS
jgi:hypothetical protein